MTMNDSCMSEATKARSADARVHDNEKVLYARGDEGSQLSLSRSCILCVKLGTSFSVGSGATR